MTLSAKKNKPIVEFTPANKAREKPHGDPKNILKATDSQVYNKNRIEKNMVTVFKPFSYETEMFKFLRGKILHPLSGDPPKSIMVTSAVPGEGKSFVSANLAVTIAQLLQESVLLMDCDLRKPRIHTMFGFPDAYGLTEHLTHDTDLAPLMLKVMSKLAILPAGRVPNNPSELLSSSKMSDLLLEMKAEYDDRYIVIDSPPPPMAPETLAISQNVDGILIVINHGSTPLALVNDLINSFEKEKIIGAVLNRFDLRSSQSYGYGKYKQYKKYYNRAE